MNVPMARRSPSPWTRYRRLDRRQKLLLTESVLQLAFVTAALAVLPFKRAIRLGCVPLGRRRGEAADSVWAIEAAARNVTWRTVCIQKGIALQRMLRTRGIDARLHYGIGTDAAEGDLAAHVWVTVDERPVIGGEEAPRFSPVAVFP